MKLVEINNLDEIFSGEYLYHAPSGQMVLCGHINEEEQTIKVLLRGRSVSDIVSNFRKIELNNEERRNRAVGRCKGCGG